MMGTLRSSPSAFRLMLGRVRRATRRAFSSTARLKEERAVLQDSVANLRDELRSLVAGTHGATGGIGRLRDQVELLARELRPERERHAASDPLSPTDPSTPSFLFHARTMKRRRKLALNKKVGWAEDIYRLSHKVRALDFAASHGVRTPAVLGSWPSPHDIPWDTLPDRFVLKNSLGGGAVNTFPVFRTEGGYLDQLTDTVLTAEEMTSRLVAKTRHESVFFAEEFLIALPGSSRAVPDDLKVFSFYGEVGLIEVRTDDWTRQKGARQRNRVFDQDGVELKGVRPFIDDDPTLPAPRDFPRLIADVSRLSGAIRRPYERIDMYETSAGIVFGEMTPDSGKTPMLIPEWDARLGSRFEKAYARILVDALAHAGDRAHGWRPTL